MNLTNGIPGFVLNTKASVASARDTYCIDFFGYEIEAGITVDFLYVGKGIGIGKSADGGWGIQTNGKPGKWSFGFIIRIKAP